MSARTGRGLMMTLLLVAGCGNGAAGMAGTAAEGGTGGTTWLAPPPVPPTLEPPAGATVKLHAHAIGAQIYTCTASSAPSTDGGAGATTYAWVLKAPDATLYDESGAQVGTHGAGPSWTWRDGSVANGTKAAEAPVADSILMAAPAGGVDDRRRRADGCHLRPAAQHRGR